MSVSTHSRQVPKEIGLAQRVRFGISPALTTPLTDEYQVDIERLSAHADDLLLRGCRYATIFGTTGEGPSFAMAERDRVAAQMVAAGLPPEKLIEGVLACSIEEAAASTRAALRRGSKAVLLAPPFYFRDPPEEAVLAWYGAVFDAVGPVLRDVILYHIPGMTGVPISLDAIAKLRSRYPGAILGVKDSACDAPATMRLI